MKEFLKEREKGITLIALVITIIVLLILAGVSIAMLTGENGIITRATEARGETVKKGLKEEIDLAVENDKIGDKAYKNGNLEEELNKINGATVTKVSEDAYCVERDGNSYTVYEDGMIEEGKIDIWDGKTIEKPEVDEQNNWHIYTTGQMRFFANYCNDFLTEEEKTEANMPEITESTIVYLENNLDMGARQKNGELVSGTNWEPIDFSGGNFEGNNHSVSGIYVKTEEAWAGFFRSCSDISNFIIKNSYIETTNNTIVSFVGSIAGVANNVTNCHNVNTEVVAKEVKSVGGIAGTVESIKDSTNSGKIMGKSYVGGIIGGFYSGDGDVVNCINSGMVIGTSDRIGGIAGQLTQNIETCKNTGKIIGKGLVGGIAGIASKNIKNSCNFGEINGTDAVGGIIGTTSNISELDIVNCYNEGKIIAEGEGAGGIIGTTSPQDTSGRIQNNYNKGEVTGKNKVGGIFGQLDSEGYIVENLYNKGKVNGDNTTGAIIGFLKVSQTNIKNLYYLNTLNIKAINGEDYVDKNIKGIAEDIDSYQEFIKWLEKQ